MVLPWICSNRSICFIWWGLPHWSGHSIPVLIIPPLLEYQTEALDKDLSHLRPFRLMIMVSNHSFLIILSGGTRGRQRSFVCTVIQGSHGFGNILGTL